MARMKSFDANFRRYRKRYYGGLGSTNLQRASALANLFGRQGVILTGAITDLSERWSLSKLY